MCVGVLIPICVSSISQEFHGRSEKSNTRPFSAHAKSLNSASTQGYSLVHLCCIWTWQFIMHGLRHIQVKGSTVLYFPSSVKWVITELWWIFKTSNTLIHFYQKKTIQLCYVLTNYKRCVIPLLNTVQEVYFNKTLLFNLYEIRNHNMTWNMLYMKYDVL